MAPLDLAAPKSATAFIRQLDALENVLYARRPEKMEG